MSSKLLELKIIHLIKTLIKPNVHIPYIMPNRDFLRNCIYVVTNKMTIIWEFSYIIVLPFNFLSKLISNINRWDF